MAEATSDHTLQDHTYAARFTSLTVGAPSAEAFTIYARSEHKLQGTFAVRFVWAD